MTTITYKKVQDIYRLSVNGHANYAEEGKDIVCSAVSILSFAAINYLEKAEEVGEADIYEIMVRDGNVDIVFKPNNEAILEGIQSVLEGYKLLAKNYPKNVNFS